MKTFVFFLFSASIIFFLVIVCLAVWKFLKEEVIKEVNCPKCWETSAGEKSSDELIGIFRKSEEPGFIQLRGGRDYKMVWYEKYKTHYKCKYCGHEWVLYRVEKQ